MTTILSQRKAGPWKRDVGKTKGTYSILRPVSTFGWAQLLFLVTEVMLFSHYKSAGISGIYYSKLNMGLTLSARRLRFNTYRFLARNLITPISEIVLLKEAFCGLPGTKRSFILKSSLKFTEEN